MNKYWEFKAIVCLFLALLIMTVCSVVKAWIVDRRKWRKVQPYYGRPYDASVQMHYRPNIRLTRP